MSIVVTGSSGFIGRALVRRLRAAGHAVVAVDREPRRAESPQAPDETAGVTTLTADLLDGDPLVEAALRDADAVVHLAGRPGVRDRSPDVQRRRERDNVEATQVVCATVPRDVPLLAASSSSVYGGARLGRASHESDPLHPRGGYSRSKVGAEAVCARRAGAGGHVLVVRPFTVVGEGQRPDMALSRWASAARTGDTLRVFGSLQRTRDFTCVREVVRGLDVLLHGGATGVVNLGSGRPRTLQEAVDGLAAAMGTEVCVQVEPAADVEVPSTWADTRRFEALTGFRPHTDLRDVAARFLAGEEADEPPGALVGTR